MTRLKVTMLVTAMLGVSGVASAYAQVPPNLGQPNGAAALNGSGVVPGAQIPFGTTAGSVADGGALAATTTTANTASTAASAASTAATAAQTAAAAALPKSGGTVTGTLVTAGVQADASKTRLTATGTAYTVPATTSWLAMVQTGTLAAQSLTLPSAPVDGQLLRISTIGQVTALTLSPTVAGWSNGATLPANAGFTLGWDATSSAWLRTQ